MNKVRVWDLPTRVFHWSLVLAFLGLITTAQIAGEAMVWHFRLGYAILSLLAFLVVWGVMGGHWSRFVVFVHGPSGVFRYIRRPPTTQPLGHNPLGALSVLALLFFPLLQVVTGLMSDDDIATSGPLAKMVSSFWVSKATHYHTAIGQYVLYALVLLHISAIIFYRVKRNENLVPAMWHGDTVITGHQSSARDDVKSRVWALVIFSVCTGLVAGFVRWAG